MTIIGSGAGTAITEGPFPRAIDPPNLQTPFPEYYGRDNGQANKPGIVEIKPHNVAGIRSGLEQLVDRLRTKNEADPNKRWPGRAYLLTYHYDAAPTFSGSTVTGFLLRPHVDALKEAGNLAEKKRQDKKFRMPRVTDQKSWLTKQGTWWKLDRQTVTELPFGDWLRIAGPPTIGSMLEGQLRTAFVKAYKVPPPTKPDDPMKSTLGHLTYGKKGSGGGADIEFKELTEFLYELEAALGRAA